MRENEDLLPAVLDLAKLFGVMAAHFRPAQIGGRWTTAVQGDGAGYPDLTLCGSRTIFRELKTDIGKLRPDQEVWFAALLASGADVDVWNESDLRSGRIEHELRSIRPRPSGVIVAREPSSRRAVSRNRKPSGLAVRPATTWKEVADRQREKRESR